VFVGARRLRVDASRRVTLSLQCAADTHGVCAGTVSLTPRRSGGQSLGSGRFRVAPLATTGVVVRATRRLARQVRRAGRRGVKVWARVRVHDVVGRRSNRSVQITLRAATRS
jgi:hypothetical protein